MVRPVLNLTSGFRLHEFSVDGRIVVAQDDRLTTYQVDHALEYRAFVHVFIDRLVHYEIPSIRPDGRVLAVGTDRGVALWDLARGTELTFLPIGLCRHILFEASGDLIASGPGGVRQWPVRLDPERGEFRIGPPGQSWGPGTDSGIAADRSGRIVARADRGYASVATPERTITVGPLKDCRYVAVSPDGEWLATGNHETTGAQVWRIRDGSHVRDLRVDGITRVAFSPDGKWLMTSPSPCRLWAVGTWEERQIGGQGRCFSPDGRLTVVTDADKAILLLKTDSGRRVARLESPDSCTASWMTFSPDGARLVVVTRDGPAVHVWDLRAIRRRLAAMNLDWDEPAYPDDDPADSSALPLPPLQVDLGPPAG